MWRDRTFLFLPLLEGRFKKVVESNEKNERRVCLLKEFVREKTPTEISLWVFVESRWGDFFVVDGGQYS